jgi:hypothetical protein
VLLKTCRDGCGETEGESDWEFCACWSLLSLKNNRAGSAGEDIYRNNEWNTQGREKTTYRSSSCMRSVNVRYGAIASRAFFNTKFLQLLLDKLFLQRFPGGLECGSEKERTDT